MDIPAYKPSGAGGHKDLKNIKIAEMLGWGGYKGQLHTHYKDVAGIQWINGRRVYREIELKDRLNPGTKERNFLEFLGFDQNDIERLNSDIENGDNKITSAKLGFRISKDYDKQDMEIILNYMIKLLRSVDFIDMSLQYESYGRSIFDIGMSYGTKYPKLPDNFGGNIFHYKPYDFDKVYGGINGSAIVGAAIKPKPAGISRSTNFAAYKNGINVTSTIPQPIRELIVMLTILHRDMVDIEYLHVVKGKIPALTYFGEIMLTTPDNANLWIDKKARLTRIRYDRFNVDKILDHYEYYIKRRQEYVEPTENIGKLLWIARDYSLRYKMEEITEGMFYVTPPNQPWDPDKPERIPGISGGQWGARVYLKVDGWNGVSADEYGYLMSAFMDIRYKRKKQGFFKRFIGGLIKFITKLVGAVLKLLMKIPGLRQIIKLVIKVIASIMGVNINVAQDMLIQVLAGLLMMAIGSLLMPGTSGLIGGSLTTGATSGLSSLITYSSQAMSMYNSMMQGMKIGYAREANEERIERDKQRAKAKDVNHKANEAFFGTMGTYQNHMSQDNMMYNLMFNPFDIHQQAIKPELLNESMLPF